MWNFYQGKCTETENNIVATKDMCSGKDMEMYKRGGRIKLWYLMNNMRTSANKVTLQLKSFLKIRL